MILSKGERVFCGTLEELRQQYPMLETGTPLEDIFFKATSASDPDAYTSVDLDETGVGQSD